MSEKDPLTETDPDALADELEQQTDRLEQRSRELGDEAGAVRQDWQSKREDQSVPGAPPPPDDEVSDDGEDARRSPAPEAPPEGAGPGAAQTPPEGGAGPPADTGEEGD